MTKSAPFIYQRVKGALVDMISSGRFEPGDKLPSERDLAKTLGCNYHTVRRGLALLEDERVIERRVGAGTFLLRLEKRGQEPFSPLRERKTAGPKSFMGIIYPPKVDEFGTELIHQLHHEAERRGFKIMIQTVSDFGAPARETARDFVKQGCFGLLFPVIPAALSVEEAWQLVRPLEVPVVLGRPLPGLEKYCYEKQEVFGKATYAAVEMACRYFKQLGYDEIAFFGADDREDDLQRRLLAYTRFASREGRATHIGLVGPRAQEVDQIVERWSSMAGRLAVVCYGDEDALRLMTALHKRDLQIPRDVAVLGFKNIAQASTSDPPLSTIQFDYEYLARAILDHAEALRQGGSAQADGAAKQQLIIRDSCGGKTRAGDKLPEVIAEAQDACN